MQLDDIKAVLNSIPSQVAVLDVDGVIVQVNEAWSTFAHENGGPDKLAKGVGTNYLEVCQSAGAPWAEEVPVAHDGIRAVLSGERTTFDLEYPCNSPTEKRWFLMTVSPFKGAHGGAVLSHVNITERKLAEIRRAGFDRILESSLNEIYIFDAETLRFIEVNDGARRNLGYTLEELQTMTPVDIKPEHTAETFVTLISPLLKNGKDKIVFTTVHRRKDGTDYPVEVHLQHMMFDDRQVFVAIIHDITERQSAEERVSGLRKMLEASINEIMMLDEETLHFVHANQGARNNLGYSMEQLAAMTPLDIKPEFTRETLEAILEPLRSNEKKIVDFTTVHQRKDGSTYPVEVHLQRSMLDSKPVFTQIILDVTEQKQAEEALRHQFQLNKTITDNAASCLFMMDKKGHPTFMNPAAERVSGYTLDEIRDMPLHDAIHYKYPDGSSYPMSECPIDNAQAELKAMVDYEDIFVRKDGSLFPVICYIAPLERAGEVVGSVLEFRDVTEQKQAEEELRKHRDNLEQLIEERTQELEAFGYSVSHDLRAPLRAIHGFSQILKDDYADKLDTEGQLVLGVIQTNVRNMGQLIDDLLAFSHLGRMKIRVKKINMERLVRDVFEELQQAKSGVAAQLEVKALPPGHGDPALARVVLVNLLSNAIKFSKPGEQAVIEVGGSTEGNEISYYVKDNGVGFDMAYVGKLFQVFQRLHRTVEFEGTGIGLALVQRIIHRHGGQVFAEGKVNVGATFRFTLPIDGE